MTGLQTRRHPPLLPAEDSSSGPQSNDLAARDPSGDRAFAVGLTLLAGQLLAMLVFSTVQYHRYGLTNDFAGYAQAWYLIGHGHLNPYVTVFRIDFLHNNLDLAMYPLALVGQVIRTPAMLSWAQDAAVVATEAFTLMWVRDIVWPRRNLVRLRAPIIAGVAILWAFNPWSWETIAFSLHFEAFATLFAVLAARDLWLGRHRRLFVWIALAMCMESLGSLYVIAVGAAAAVNPSLPRGTRRVAGLVALSGSAGLLAVSQLHLIGRGGSTLGTAYSYLVAGHKGPIGLSSLLIGALTHLPSVASTIAAHAPYVIGYIMAGGLLGLATSWGAAAVLVIILPNALSAELPFIAFPGAFQSWPAQPFLIVGTAIALCSWLARSKLDPPRPTHGMRRVIAAILAGAATLAALQLITMPRRWMPSADESTQLRQLAARIPAGVEVVAHQNDIGRFAMNRVAYDYVNWGDRVPVVGRQVVVIVKVQTDQSDRVGWADLLKEFRLAQVIYEGSTFKAYLVTPNATSITVR